MGLCCCCREFMLKLFRFCIQLITNFICRLTLGKPDQLPPLRNKLLLQPATILAEKIRKREVSSIEIVEAMIERAKSVQPYINAVVDDVYDEALVEARKVDELIASGAKSTEEMQKETPLLGVPFTIKEYIAVKGMYFTNGLYSRRGVRADFDADVVQRLKRAGAIPLAKTNIPELSFWSDCGNHVYGSTRNPYDTRRIPGGSTGGEGALIGSGASLIGLGSDIGGSLRLPAFQNGIFSHKPTAGLIPDVGTYPPFPESISSFYSSLGPLCRYAMDLRPVMKLLAGEKLNLDKPVDFRKLKIYYAEETGHPLATPVIPEIKAALAEAVRHFEKKYDITAERVNFEELRDSYLMWFHILADAGLPPIELALTDGKGKFNLPFELLKWCFGASNHTAPALALTLGLKFLPGEKSEARKEMRKKFASLKTKFEAILQEDAVFLYPTQPRIANFLHSTIPAAFDIGHTCVINILGFPATQTPLRLCKGLPIGIQIVGNYNRDGLTISVAEELEKAFGGWTCPSPII